MRRTLPKITALMGETFSDQEFEEAVAFGAPENLRNLERQGFFRQGGLTLRNPRTRKASRCAAPRSGLQGLFHRGAGRRAGGPGAEPPVAELRLRSARRARPPRGVMAGRLRGCRHGGSSRRSGGRRPCARWRPGVWLLLGDKPGDNAQVEAVALALGWPRAQDAHWRHRTHREAALSRHAGSRRPPAPRRSSRPGPISS